MKILYRMAADAVWFLHFLVVCIALFGWLVPSLWLVYVAVLLGTLMSTFAVKYCVLSKWEFDLRRNVDPSISYDFTYASFYTYRLTRGRISPTFLARAGVLFCSCSLALAVYFHLTR